MCRAPGPPTVLVVLALVVWLAVPLFAQSVSVSSEGDALSVRAPELSFIKGETLARLEDGRLVRVDLELAVLAAPGAPAAAETSETFVLSYDLWEERFAVTHAGTPPHSISHLTSRAAEAWCLEQVAVPLGALGRLGREVPFWIRLGYRVLDGDGAPAADEFTLQGLIDALSRRRRSDALTDAIEAGPFRLRR